MEDEIRRQTQPVLSQSSFVSQNDSRLHFGLGAAKSKEIHVVWPNGASEDFGAFELDRIIHLREGVRANERSLHCARSIFHRR